VHSLMRMPSLETERLLIRPLVEDDLNSVCELFSAVGWDDSSFSAAEERARRKSWLDWSIRNEEELARLHQPPYGDRAIVLREDKGFIGLVGFVPRLEPFAQLPGFGAKSSAPTTAEVGLFWAIAPRAQRRGYAAEAARALIEFAFVTLKLARIIAGTDHGNEASMGVMRKLGMRIEANPYPYPSWFQVCGILEDLKGSDHE